ncbi:hypothetical protein [Microbacterium sp. IO18]|uniref:hypothetical protein n=1 Tax=Microbacterium sp. IO18 TaxID=3390997 RepID=UPI003BA19CFD
MTESDHGGDRNSVPARYTAAQRANEALQLRLMRVSYRDVAKRVGYANPGSAYRAVERALKALPKESAKELREQELEALDVAQRAIMRQVLTGHLGAIDRMLRLMDARARLAGLYAVPNDTGVDEFKTVLKAWAATLATDVDAEEERLARTSEQITEERNNRD